MSATNTTTYYEFPVFVGSDKPAWLVDWNGAMNSIDSAIHEAKAEADANASSISSIQSDVSSLAGSVSSQGSSITTLTQSLTSLQGTVNTITSLIGNGEPTTTDKTIIGAINELNAGKASDTEVGTLANLTTTVKTDLVSAINEVNGKKYTKVCEVTCDGVKTISQIYDELYALLNAENIDLLMPLYLVYSDSTQSAIYARTNSTTSMPFTFSNSRASSDRIATQTAYIKASGSVQYMAVITSGGSLSVTDESSSVWTNGAKVTVVY